MTAQKFDPFTIGAGQFGPALAARLDKDRLKIALVEHGKFGGTCVDHGGTPTKALIASACALHMARRLADGRGLQLLRDCCRDSLQDLLFPAPL